jgi:AcrR family transcriptional regulator
VTPRRARGEPAGATQEAILRATAEILRDTPLADVAVRDILERAGVSRATFYFYFASKYAPVATLFRGILEDVLAVFDRYWASAEGGDPAAGLRDALAASYTLFAANAPLLRAVADARADPEIGEAFHAMIDRLIAMAQAKIERDAAAGDAHALAAAMIWMNERCFYLHSLGAGSPWADDDEMLDALAAVWAGTVYGAS